MFLRLFALAPLISIKRPSLLLRFFGTGINLRPLRYWPVIDCSDCLTTSAVPCATTLPPCSPAPGPMSIIWSAAYIVSSSCSTTSSVFPRSRKCFNVSSNLLLSRWCSPILGSSKIYNTPTKPEPICVARRIRCASPPESVPAARSKVR